MTLTDEQRNALWDAEGRPVRSRRIVSARPGTGKTTTLTQYCIALADDWREHYAPWQGLAAISYTNVAKDELERKIRTLGKANSLLSPPHFVGTIDSFLNQYLFLPFGSSEMNTSLRPKLVGEPYSSWRALPHQIRDKPAEAYSPMFFDCYGLGPDDRPLLTDTAPRRLGNINRAAEKVTDRNVGKIVALKKYIWQQGYALQSDANYFAYKALIRSPDLTKCFIKRFPVLVIDEAQDMTEVQHALLDHLKQSGQEHVVLIGDEYQAIYEWNTARPQLFVDKVRSADWSTKTIVETFRCSPSICSILSRLAADGASLLPSSNGKNSKYADTVQVIEYDTDPVEQKDVRSAIDLIASELSDKEAHDGNEENIKTIAVLARSKSDVAKLQAHFAGEAPSGQEPASWEYKLTKDYLKVICYLSRADYYNAFKAYESLLFNSGEYENKSAMRLILNRIWNPGDPTIVAYRKTLFGDLNAIADAFPGQDDLLISACAGYCDVQLKCLGPVVLRAIKNDCRDFLQAAKRQQDGRISSLFASRDERIFFQHPDFVDMKIVFSTVHGVKGETYDGVLFFTRATTSSCSCIPAKKKWADILNHSLNACENKRIVYVALSRAAQVLRIMAPASSADAWRAFLDSDNYAVNTLFY